MYKSPQLGESSETSHISDSATCRKPRPKPHLTLTSHYTVET